jgi:hypothetical protein
MRGEAVNRASGARRGPKVVLGMLGAVALMAGTAVVALANHLGTLTLTSGCVDTYTDVTFTIADAYTGNVLELDLEASKNGSSYTVAASQHFTIPSGYSGQTYSPLSKDTWIGPVSSTYLSGQYTYWEVVYATSSGVDNQNNVGPVTTRTLCSPNPNTPESPLAVALPLAGLAIFAGTFGVVIRRRRSASAV